MANKYLDFATLKVYASVATANDDSILQMAADRADMEIERETDSCFVQTTYTGVRPITSFIDGNGWLHMIAREGGPVSAVAKVEVMDLAGGSRVWQQVDDLSGAILPSSPTISPPEADAWSVMVWPALALYGKAKGQILVRWTYTAGYATIPNSLKALGTRLAHFIYKLREAPMGKVVTAELGLMTIPLSIPPDIRADLQGWKRVANG